MDWIIAGVDPANRQWSRGLCSSLTSLSDNPYRHEYKHWDESQGHKEFAYELEFTCLSQLFKAHMQEHAQQPFLICKSIGTVLVLDLIKEFSLSDLKAVFIGLPLNLDWKGVPTVKNLVSYIPGNSILIQEESDPLGSHRDVEKVIAGYNLTLHGIPGDTHQYPDFSVLSGIIDSWKTK